MLGVLMPKLRVGVVSRFSLSRTFSTSQWYDLTSKDRCVVRSAGNLGELTLDFVVE
jgi:hypothetical protein